MKKGIICLLAALLFTVISCDFSNSADISIDGSSTVSPITNAVVEEFAIQNRGVDIVVGVSGTGGGFKKFVTGEIDITNASRKIKAEEIEKSKKSGVEFLEIQVGTDGLTVVVNKENGWFTETTVEELKKIWEEGSDIKKWSDINPVYPDISIKMYGPDQDSGTYDYFLEEIIGHKGRLRADYSPASDDNQLVQGIEGDKGAIGFFGYAYYLAQKDKLRVLNINGVSPREENIRSGKYVPLSRPLYIYVNKKSLDGKPFVRKFVQFYLQNAAVLVREEGYVPLESYSQQEQLIK